MTQDDLQDAIHALLENDSETPEFGDDSYTVRTRLLNQSIRVWENERDVLWKELWATETGDTVLVGDTTYSAPSDFKMPGGYIKFTDSNDSVTKLRVIDVEDFQRLEGEHKVCYFTGNPKDGYVLNLGWTPSASDALLGADIEYPYYKTADALAAVSDKPEMSDPMFAVFWTAAHQALAEGDNNAYSVFFAQAQDRLSKMREANESGTNLQDNLLVDEEWEQDSVAIGL